MNTRRSFLQTAAAAPAFLRNLISAPRNSTLSLASFGGNGMAWSTLDGIATHPKVRLACVAEVDSSRLERVKQKYAAAATYDDWRRMLEKERSLDIACVGTPDHMHAPMAMAAMERGLHVYVQKPLAHSIGEVRALEATARKKKLVSQMGIQIHSNREYRAAVALIHAGAIGKVKEVHSWSDKKWGDLDPRPNQSDPVPPTLNWDVWLGVAEPRPYVGGTYYHPQNWRKRIDFGTATFGDMGCHILDPVFGSLRLKAPLSVRCESSAPNQYNWALDTVIRYVFPGTPLTAGKRVNVTWYDGDQHAPAEVLALLGSVKPPAQGSIFIGTKGVMLLPHVATPVLLPEERFRGYPIPQLTTDNHYHEFVNAVLGQGHTSAPFDYSGPLTEAVLLGPVATRYPHTTLEWDSHKLHFRNSPDASHHVTSVYRSGWQMKDLG
jgi:predicted dehydrogenase